MPGLTRRSLLGAAGASIAAPAVLAQPRPAGLVPYTTFGGDQTQLRPFVGTHFALLIDPSRTVDRMVTDRVLSALDRAWLWYRALIRFVPEAKVTYAGKPLVAEGKGNYAHSGQAGFELQPSTMTLLLTEARRDRYSQASFYLMALNFWFFGQQLGKIDAFSNGFAHVHRFHSIEGSGLTGAPWDDDFDFDHYRKSIIIDMLTRYLADPKLNWENTLAAEKAPDNPHGWVASDLAAAFFHRIRIDHGYAGYRRFWAVMMDAPEAKTPRESAERFVQVARVATGADYRWMMRDQSLNMVY
jgi:hypothetical protein